MTADERAAAKTSWRTRPPPRSWRSARILNEEVEHEAWFIELLSKERDGVVRPSGHFRRGEPGDAPYSKNRGFYNP